MTEKRSKKANSGCNLTPKPTSTGVHFKFFPRFDGLLLDGLLAWKKLESQKTLCFLTGIVFHSAEWKT